MRGIHDQVKCALGGVLIGYFKIHATAAKRNGIAIWTYRTTIDGYKCCCIVRANIPFVALINRLVWVIRVLRWLRLLIRLHYEVLNRSLQLPIFLRLNFCALSLEHLVYHSSDVGAINRRVILFE